MKQQHYVLVNSLPLDVISGGNIYNQNLCNAFKESKLKIDYIFTQQIEETLLQLNENIIILLDSYCLNETLNWSKLINKKIIILLHLAPSADDQKVEKKLKQIIETETFVFKNFPIITAGKKAIDYIEEKYHFTLENYVIIPPAINLSWKKKNSYNLLPIKLLVIATITERKGYKRLIETLSKLREIEWICDCYGVVSNKKLMIEINHLIKKNHLENRINFCGTINNSEMDILQNNYDLLLQLSDQENNSVALIEAIASGLPFISTPTGNSDYFKQKKCGLICSSFESEIIAHEISPILTDKIAYKELIHSLDNVNVTSWKQNIDDLLEFTKKIWN